MADFTLYIMGVVSTCKLEDNSLKQMEAIEDIQNLGMKSVKDIRLVINKDFKLCMSAQMETIINVS